MLIRQLLDGDYPSPDHLKHSILYVLVNLVKASETSIRSEEAGNFISEMEFQIPACRALEEVKEKAGYYLNRIIDSIESRKNNKNERIIAMCKTYLAEHYMEDLSLELIAKRFFFSAAYFSSFSGRILR
ncbi:hypothetical protein HMSSN139_13480 [Paenibacillus sp. HMSSN-139]|nr:hypothetical protein HMSSN139_13480 [Paenibacillus sp. HMSSN-139]